MGVAVPVEGGDCVPVGEAVNVELGKRVVVGVLVAVAVPALEPNVITSSGGLLPSLDEKRMESELSATSTSVYVPLPVTKGLLLYSTQVFVRVAPLLSRTLLVRAGRFLQVIPVSVQLLPAPYTAGLFAEALVVT